MTAHVVKEIFASVNGVSSLVSRIHADNFEVKTCRKAVVVVPGNPGIIQFYDSFLESLYQHFGEALPMFGIQHAGHGTLKHSEVHKPYDLTEQIQHKIAFIEEFFPKDCRLILIGHSIGAYIILKIFEHYGVKQEKIIKGIFLFPTIERMALTPSGRIATPVSKYFSWLVVAGAWAVSCIPHRARKWMINWWFSKRNVSTESKDAVLDLLTANGIRSMLYMAADEMDKVDKTPVQLIADHIDKLIFYYGSSDPWTPRHYYNEMMHRFPNAKIYVCGRNIKHAFVLESSEIMAEIVATWISEEH